jgi:hypothetical protein
MRVKGFVTGSFSVVRARAARGLIADSARSRSAIRASTSQQAARILGHDG